MPVELSSLVAEGEGLGITGGVADGIPFATDADLDALDLRVVALEDSAGASNAVWIGAGEFGEVTAIGSPVLSHIQRWTAWLLDQSTAEAITATVGPDEMQGWLTYAIDIYWSSGSVGTGAVRFRVDRESAGDADPISTTGTTGTAQNFTTAGTNVMNVELAVETGLTVVADEPVSIRVIRDAANAGDTLAGDIGIIGVRLRKLT